MRFKIYRYDPDKDAQAVHAGLRLELEPSDRMLLDALIRIKAAGRLAVAAPLVPRRRMRLRRDEHQRQERARVHYARWPISKSRSSCGRCPGCR